MSEEGGKGAPPVPSISMATEGSSSAPLQTKYNKGKGVGKKFETGKRHQQEKTSHPLNTHATRPG
ncbi:hypothetical protein ElyMa_001033100 [Elysia marginata]|uniref:PEST proteolytic signal-containing nuclear protein n=1 Tax=Elysia marginata TaxID=1093978 RepID=A0AAV4HQC9_9GAST|nr:hypothetical protein ElyMa_001033100 [Elysia marginata]